MVLDDPTSWHEAMCDYKETLLLRHVSSELFRGGDKEEVRRWKREERKSGRGQWQDATSHWQKTSPSSENSKARPLKRLDECSKMFVFNRNMKSTISEKQKAASKKKLERPFHVLNSCSGDAKIRTTGSSGRWNTWLQP